MTAVVIGLDRGASKLAAALASPVGQVIARTQEPSPSGRGPDRGFAVDCFSVLTDSYLTVDAALCAGADGVVPGLGNVDPPVYVRLYRLRSVGDWTGARAEQERPLRLMAIADAGDAVRMGRGSSALGAFKAALHLLGVIEFPLTAAPEIALDEVETAVVRKHFDVAGLL